MDFSSTAAARMGANSRLKEVCASPVCTLCIDQFQNPESKGALRVSNNGLIYMPSPTPRSWAASHSYRPSPLIRPSVLASSSPQRGLKRCGTNQALIDCVISHLQPAFDHPKLRRQRPLDPPSETLKDYNSSVDEHLETIQLWTKSNEFCLKGTVPIRRTTEEDVLRASSLKRFRRKIRRGVRHGTMSGGHEHAVTFVNGDEYYGAKASINVWMPAVTDPYETSLVCHNYGSSPVHLAMISNSPDYWNFL